MKNLSIIVPVYNGEKFIEKCIQNLESIKLNDFEIIIINDGSTDNTAKEIERVINNYNNIKYIYNKKNKGVSLCRNIGIKTSKGKYITFMDVDDEMTDYAYSKMIDTANTNKADVVVCNFVECEEKKLITKSKYKYTFDQLDNIETIRNYLIDRISPSSCDKIYKRELLRKLKFNQNLQVGEDLLFCLNVFLLSKKTCFINEYYYKYYKQQNSVMHNIAQLSQFKKVFGLINKENLKLLEKNYPKEIEFFKLQMIARAIHSISDLVNKNNKKEIRRVLKKSYTKKDLNKIIKCRYFLKSVRLEILILRLFGIRFHLFMMPIYKKIKSKIR